MSKKMCIYHGGCNDGFGAAYAVWKKFGNIEFHPGIYQEEIPDVKGKSVIMVDFSYKLNKLKEIMLLATDVTIIDHHKTAQEDIQPLLDSREISGIFDMNKSGAVLAWEYYHNETVPRLLEYIQDRDLWKFELPDSKALSEGLNLVDKDFELWDMASLGELITEGRILQRMHRRRVDEVKEHAWIKTISGYDVPVVNAPYYLASDVAGELSEGYPFAAVFWSDKYEITYSLRSRKDGIDVSKVANKLGGGGHERAAGFKIKI